MAITSFDITCKPPKSLCSTNSHKSNNVPCRMVKINFVSNSSATSTTNKSTKLKKNNSNSPYLKNDRVQLLSRVTEKRLVHKKTTDFISSFPLAANIYRANSDELNSLRRTNKKVKKSVLTLPNEPAPLPQVCTVSDMNDSEYQEHKNENNRCKVKKQPLPNRKIRVRNKGYEFYDRDARYCSQLNIDLDCSSTDIIDYNGDSKRHSKMNKCSKIKKQENDSQGHDVWAVLRNINRFQFQPSPPMSEESVLLKKKKGPKRRSNCKDTRVIETCHTEEFAYISSYELEGQSNNTFSQSSSLDRITVIDKQDDFSQMCDEFEKSITTSDLINNTCNQKRRNPTKNKNPNRNIKNVKSRCNPPPKENCNRSVVLSKNKFKALKKKTSEKDNCQNINNSDIISPKSNIISTTPAVNDDRIEFLCSTHSGSSKAGFEVVSQNILKDPNSWLKASSDESTPQIIGISKVVLSKGYEKPVSKSYDMQKEIKKKPHLVTTMLSATLTPKLTQTEIKRRLSRIKFPVVILAKDEVSSGIEIVNYDPPHLDGLDKHIWPFMLEWDGNIKIKNEISAISERKLNSLEISRKCTPNISNYNDMKLRKNNNTKIEKQSNYMDKKYLRNEQVRNKIKVDDKAPTPFTSIGNKFQQYKKQKPILQLKERVLHLLYKKSNRSITKESLHSDEKKRVQSPFVNKVHMGTDVQLDYDDIASEDLKNLKHKYTSSLKSSPVIRPQNNVKQRWAKAKWASDFIENVIRKIKNGAYYTHENKDIRRKYKTGIKEMSIQTIPNHKHYLNPPSHEINEQTEDPFKIISECDNTLSAVEIKTFNRNQIAIKHCVTNVMVQFDVSIPTETTQIIVNAKRSSSLIPLEITASHTKIYKSKTKIVNGVLPAELCSILPKMIRNILEAKPKLTQETMPSIVFDKSDSQLTIISELSRSESPDFLVGFPLSSGMLPELRKTFEGAFSKEINKFKCLPINTFRKTDYKSNVIISLLPKISFNDMLSSELNIKIPRIIRNRNTLVGQMKDLNNLHKPKRTSSALVTYTVSQHNLKPTYKRYDLMSMIENMTCHNNFQDLINSIHSINNLTLQYDGRNLKVNMFIRNKRGIDENTTLIINNSPFNAELKTNYEERPIKGNMFLNEINCIGDNHIMPVKKLEGKESKGQLIVALNKGRKKGFVKLYKKCKSTSNIFNGDKLSNTPLSKISSLDDFFQVLGSNKSLSSMFDGYTGKKILSSLKEMNNWTTDINPRQAMLVLLLTNKKDTGNLVRFRPILLQGIAVNRITRATELDMEIEVIERENFNKLSQYEGVSYSLESVVNHDNLLEELCWIAKTTASDYQRPFDDSSERLLKSLLEKRKKLNPSYLRVMARYVGLGLLKSPLKK